MREKARVADHKATALQPEAADAAKVNLADAQAVLEAAAGNAKEQEDKAVRAKDAAKFDANNRATREGIATGTLEPELTPTAPTIVAIEQALQTTVSPAHTQRTASSSSNTVPWHLNYAPPSLPTCLGGGSGGPARFSHSSRDLSNRRRRRKLNVDDK